MDVHLDGWTHLGFGSSGLSSGLKCCAPCSISSVARTAKGQFCLASFVSAGMCFNLCTEETGKDSINIRCNNMEVWNIYSSFRRNSPQNSLLISHEICMVFSRIYHSRQFQKLYLFPYSSLPSFFGIGINGFSTLQRVIVPGALQTNM